MFAIAAGYAVAAHIPIDQNARLSWRCFRGLDCLLQSTDIYELLNAVAMPLNSYLNASVLTHENSLGFQYAISLFVRDVVLLPQKTGSVDPGFCA